MDVIREFTFVTYNIDGGKYNREERLKTLLEKIASQPPDVVVIQEGTRLVYEKLLREMGLLGYKRQLLDVMNSRNYGEIMFSKFPISEGGYVPFKKTKENRGISYFRIDVDGIKNIIICTSQFDVDTSHFRMQLVNFPFLMKGFSSEDNIIFGGDTRISEYQKDLSEPTGWVDSWYESGKDDSKYTFDSHSNILAKQPYRDRPDRTWFRPSSQKPKIESISCELYGKNKDETSVTISSHYGVLTKFKIIE
jgi:exonuclease III